MIADRIINTIQAAFTSGSYHPGDRRLEKLLQIGTPTSSGVAIDHEKVMALPAVMRAVNILSNGVAKVPFYVFENDEDGETRSWNRSHPSWTAVTRKPNAEFTARTLRKTLTSWALLWGNGVAYIDRPQWPSGTVRILPLLPDRTYPIRASGLDITEDDLRDENDIYFTTTIGGKQFSFPAMDCIHIKGLGPSPYWGYDIVDTLKEAFGGVAASAEFGHRFYGQGANPAGFVEMPGGLDEESEKRFIDSLKRASSGLAKSHRLAVLEEGAKFHPWTIDPDKAQFLEGKQFDVRTIAMAIGIKVHKLIDSANSSYNSLEQANQEHKDDDLIPWIDAWRDELNDKLLTEQQKETGSHTIDIDDEFMDFVPFRDRASGVVELFNNGLIDEDEGRRKVNFGPRRPGRRYRMPRNIGFEGENVQHAGQIEPDDDSASSLQVVSDAYVAKIAKRLAKQAVGKITKGLLVDWSESLEPESGPEMIQAQIDEVYSGLREAIAGAEENPQPAIESWLETNYGEKL